MTADGFCKVAECYGTGFLKEITAAENAAREVGLAILLMDVSGSMKAPIVSGALATKAEVVARNAAEGIMSLADMSNIADAYIMPVPFDHELHPVFLLTVREIVDKFHDSLTLADELKRHFTYGSTDINQALAFSKRVYDSLVQEHTLAPFGGPDNVQPIFHQVPLAGGGQKPVPNIRVLIYTDGHDEIRKTIEGNPFLNEETDILLGAFLGDETEAGCAQLKNILSKCPTHDRIDQFFLLNAPDRIQKLRFLFRMASNRSGFCPTCLAADITDAAYSSPSSGAVVA